MPVQEADGHTTTSAPSKASTIRRTSGTASRAYPVLKCSCPQHVCSSGKSTSWPSRSSSATVALPVAGKSVSLKHAMNSATRIVSSLYPFRRYARAATGYGFPRYGSQATEGEGMYEQVFDPVSSSLGLSAIFAALPLITLFVMLGGFRITAWISGLVSLAVAIVVAIAVWDVPVGQSLDMGAEGAAFGFFPILWIVINAVWIYNLTEKTGHFAVLRRSFAKISDDKRIQAVIIAFAFGALIEGLAGFGTPVAITTVMLMALGFSPIKSAALSLIGNTAPVAFGSIATPIVTLSAQTDIPIEDLGAMVGRQTPFLALIVPLVLVGAVDDAHKHEGDDQGEERRLAPDHGAEVFDRDVGLRREGHDRGGNRAERHGGGVADQRQRSRLDRREAQRHQHHRGDRDGGAEAGQALDQRTEGKRDDHGLDPLVVGDLRERAPQHREMPGLLGQVVDPDRVDHDPEDREEAEGSAFGAHVERLPDRHVPDRDRHDDRDRQGDQPGDPCGDAEAAQHHEQRDQRQRREDRGQSQRAAHRVLQRHALPGHREGHGRAAGTARPRGRLPGGADVLRAAALQHRVRARRRAAGAPDGRRLRRRRRRGVPVGLLHRHGARPLPGAGRAGGRRRARARGR